MASCLPPSSAATHVATTAINQTKAFSSVSYSRTSYYTLCYRLNLHRPFLISSTSSNKWSGRCRATSPGPPSPPPKSDPQPPVPSESSSGIGATLTKIQDKAQILVAVLFWMTLFFWASAWDGRNNDRTNGGSRFR